MKTNNSKKQWANNISRNLFWELMFVLGICVGCHSVKLPTVINENPSMLEIQQAVNQNSARIKTLQSKNASVGLSNMPGMANCQLAFERERRVRLIGNANMMGRVIDCGCNDELFWFWSKFQEPMQISYCRLNELSSNSLTDAIPLDPTWFPEVLGIVEFKTDEEAEGPTSQSDGTLMIKTKKNRSNGQYTKYTYIEPKTAAVKRQDIQDPNGNTVISVLCTEFQYDETQKIVLPQKLVINFPKSNDSLHLNLGDLNVNSVDEIPTGIFDMPKSIDLNNSPIVNIGTKNGVIPSIKQPVETESPVQTNETSSQNNTTSSDSFQPINSMQTGNDNQTNNPNGNIAQTNFANENGNQQQNNSIQPIQSTQPVYSYQTPGQFSGAATQSSATAQTPMSNQNPTLSPLTTNGLSSNNAEFSNQNAQNSSFNSSINQPAATISPSASGNDMLLSDSSSLMASYLLPQSNYDSTNQQANNPSNNSAVNAPNLMTSPSSNNISNGNSNENNVSNGINNGNGLGTVYNPDSRLNNNVPPVLNQTTNSSQAKNVVQTPNSVSNNPAAVIPTQTLNSTNSYFVSGSQNSVEATSSFQTLVIP